MRRPVRAASIFLVFAFLVVGLLLSGGADQRARASDGTIDYVALDADPTDDGGNTATSLGDPAVAGVPQFDRCVQVATSTSFDIDIVIDAVPDVADPSVDGLTGTQYVIAFDDANLTLNSADYDFLLASNSGQLLKLSTSSPQAELQVSGPRVLGLLAVNLQSATTVEAVQGTGVRLTFTSGASDGLATITLLPSFDAGTKFAATKMVQFDGGLFPIDNLAGTARQDKREVTVAVGAAVCPSVDVAVDTDTTDNTASSLGTRQSCTEVTNSATFDADITIDAIPDVDDPTVDGLGGAQYVVRYGSDLLTLNSADRAFLLANDPDSVLVPDPDSAPTELAGGPPRVVAFGNIDSSGGAGAEENIRGVGARLNFTAHASATGVAEITILPTFGINDTKLTQVDTDLFILDEFLGGYIVVGVPGGCTDDDGDAVPNAADLCSGTSGGQVDVNGCSDEQVDEDGDGVCSPGAASGGPSGCTGSDLCSATPGGQPVDGNGCSDDQVDEDSDGVCDHGASSAGPSGCTGSDLCPGTAPGATVDSSGCSDEQVDEDSDGVCDLGFGAGCTGTDLCLSTAPGATVDSDGCSDLQVDEDLDTICNNGAPSAGPGGCTGSDLCPATTGGQPADGNGCSDQQVDGDSDGACDPGAASGGPSGCTGSDNCPSLPNPSQANTDADNEAAGFRLGSGVPPPILTGDSNGDVCDSDDDNDGFSETDERAIYGVGAGSPEELTPCRTATVTDPWPPDMAPVGNPDRVVDISDLGAIVNAGLFLSSTGRERFNLFVDDVIDISDLGTVVNAGLFQSCQPP